MTGGNNGVLLSCSACEPGTGTEPGRDGPDAAHVPDWLSEFGLKGRVRAARSSRLYRQLSAP
ncbi:hypothetical protein [Deinococcus koreensis]|uniref:hypothetical protein n=1 Tax=Deinococcus koreensis TaxID=2054903 RepID=UPI001056EAA0|nr:hypothetical protein [Deinococcus koreensis]